MAITNYTELQASVASWLHRTDISDRIIDFITFGEAKINRELNANAAEVEIDLATVVGSRIVSLPSDFVKVISVFLQYSNGSQRFELTKISPTDNYKSNENNIPRYWSIDGTNIDFDTPLSSTTEYTITLRYKAKFELSDANPTNWLLTNAPDFYLFACLLSSPLYLRDEKRIAIWQGQYNQILQSMNNNEYQSRKTVLRVDAALTDNSRFNIYRG